MLAENAVNGGGVRLGHTGSPGGSDHVFSRRFWLGGSDARAPALFRIAFGALVVSDLTDRLRDFHAFYTRDGLARAPARFTDELLQWSLFRLVGGAGLFVVAFAAAVALALGYRTRVAAALTWVAMVSLWNANPAVADGGDAVVLALLFWSLFADLGARYSLDVALGRRAPQATVAAAPIRFLQIQVAYIYLVTFLAKQGSTWTGGTAVGLALHSEWARGLAPLVAAHPRLCAALTWGTLAVEGLFPLLVFSPLWPRRLRALALGAGLGLHLGIFATMGVGIFSLVMPVSYLLFLRPEWLDRVDPGPLPTPPPAAARPLLALLAAQLAVIVAAQLFLVARGLVPAPLAAELKLTGHFQNWYMFAPDAPTATIRIAGPGVLADGRAIDVVEAIEPRLASRRGFLYSRWHKVRYALGRPQPELRLALGRYLCRRHNGEHPSPRLAHFELVLHQIATTDHATVLLQQRCF